MKHFSYFTLLLLLFGTHSTIAQEHFPHDYVKELRLEKQETQKKEQQKQKPLAGKKQVEPNKPLSSEQVREIFREIRENLVEVKGIGAFLWGGDFEHFKQHYDEFTGVAVEHSFPVSELVVVAPVKNMIGLVGLLTLGALSLEAEPEAIERSATVAHSWRLLPRLPEEYAYLERSPTYVIHTEYGNLLIEASNKAFSQFFTKKGLFDMGRYRLVQGITAGGD